MKWGRASAETLRDTEIPIIYEIYGQASFDYLGIQNDRPKRGIVWVRNPSEKTIAYTLPLSKMTDRLPGKVQSWKVSLDVDG